MVILLTEVIWSQNNKYGGDGKLLENVNLGHSADNNLLGEIKLHKCH